MKIEMNTAGWVRSAGVAAVLLSAVSYLLHGIEHIQVDLRQWVYLVMLIGLAGLGVGLKRWLDDAKGARACFALAAGALAVQMAQGAGMVHELTHPMTSFWIDFSATSATASAHPSGSRPPALSTTLMLRSRQVPMPCSIWSTKVRATPRPGLLAWIRLRMSMVSSAR